MGRSRKTPTETTEAPTTPVKKGRGKKAEAAPAAPSTEYTPKELELRGKYTHDILAGTYRTAGAPDREGWGKKHTVMVACCFEACAAEPRCVATSDLQFDTTKYCLQHSKIIKANRRRTAAAKKKL